MTNRLLLRFVASGIPRPQGSKRIVRGRMIESARGHADWRRTVAMAAMAARQEREGEWPIERPVRVSIDFLVPGRPDARPDIDKLSRAILDALTEAGVLRDDSQVIELFALKEQARRRDECGASVSVWEA
jgi:Holliday junction resolvase RusA-like endonuclease